MFSKFAIDMDVFHALALTNKAMADSYLLNHIAMKEEIMNSKLKLLEEAKDMKLKEEIMKSRLTLRDGGNQCKE